jgi:hypothetical protein
MSGLPTTNHVRQTDQLAELIDRLLAPLESNVSAATLDSLHEAHDHIKRHFGSCTERNLCTHRKRFVDLIKNRAHYIASRGWFLDRLNEGVEELRALKQFLPDSEQAAIDHEISTLEKTRQIIIGERDDAKKVFHKKTKSLLSRLKELIK